MPLQEPEREDPSRAEEKYEQKQFQEQGGAATMDPSPFKRWLTSTLLNSVISEKRQWSRRHKLERKRNRTGAAHVVEYFHQIDDPYSHLAAQLLAPLLQRYNIELKVHLVTGPTGGNSVEPALLSQLACYDAAKIAPHYGLGFPNTKALPESLLMKKAGAILAAQYNNALIELTAKTGDALWQGDEATLRSIAATHSSADTAQVQSIIDRGNARREALQHYSGAMFYYGGEWYWGVDRLYHLENRLIELGALRDKNASAQAGRKETNLIAPRPALDSGRLKDTGKLTLEIYPSLRSPYTAISFDRAVQLARDTGIKLVVRPVLPMVMRGAPVTRQKGLYIFMDTAREARAANNPLGKFYDPIGAPVRRCYSLYPWACEQSKGIELLSSFLRAAFVQGINTNSDRGFKKVIENAGLDWKTAQTQQGSSDWETLLEKNRLAMYHAGLWGVPSFRLLDANGKQALAIWGQDRLWLVAREIQRLLETPA